MSTEFWLSSVKVHYGVGKVCWESVQYVDAQMFCQNYRKLPPVIIISWDKGEIVDSVFCFEATAARNFAGL